MADTSRSKSTLATLFADNTAGDISPQDLRDFLESMHRPMGSLYVSTPAAVSVTVNEWIKANGTTTSVSLRAFTMPANNRLQYTGTPSTHVHGVMTFSMSMSGVNDQLQVAAYHYDDSAASGSILAHSIITRYVTGSDVGTGALHFDVTLDTNDYIECHVRNLDASTDITLDNLYMFMMGMFM